MTSVVRARMMQRAVCEVLAGEPDGLPVREVIARVKEAVPPDQAELTRNNSGSLRYDTSLRFWTVGLVKAGWVVKDKEGYSERRLVERQRDDGADGF